MGNRIQFSDTRINGLVRLDRRMVSDKRGFLSRLFCAEELSEIGYAASIQQINYTVTKKKGSVRGMHYQMPPHSETKIVTCVQGRVFDVAVDIRLGSPTFLNWHGEVLSSDNHASLFIPDGFSHGFQTMTDDCHLVYMHSNLYVPGAEGALNAVDPTLDIDWPLDISEMSDRDRRHPFIGSNFIGVQLS